MAATCSPTAAATSRGALAANAAAKPFNIAVLVVTMARGGRGRGLDRARARRRAARLRVAACVRTFFDEEEADAVLARVRAERRERLDARGAAAGARRAGAADPRARPSARAAARRRSARRSSAPSCPTRRSPSRSTASCARWSAPPRRAQTLYEALADNAARRAVEARLRQVRGEPGARRARRGARAAGARAAPDGGPARPLLRRDGAHDRRARHGPRQPAQPVG